MVQLESLKIREDCLQSPQLGTAAFFVSLFPTMEPTAEPEAWLIKPNGLSLMTVSLFLAGIMAGVGVLSLSKAMLEAGEFVLSAKSWWRCEVCLYVHDKLYTIEGF